MPLVERDEQLAVLAGLARGLPQGAVALVGAEAGAGKTSVLRAFVDAAAPGVPARFGRCDDLTAPASYAPIWDMALTLPPAVRTALEGRGGIRMPVALADALRERPSILAIDDVQWADEATLDLLGHLARRIDEVPVVLCVAYRSDEIDRDHRFRRVAAELSRVGTRIELPPLTLRAVRALAGDPIRDVDSIYARSGGNPFLVTELLAHDGEETPPAVADAIVARAAGLPDAAWHLLETVALAPGGIPLGLVPKVGPDASRHADLAIGRGLLEISGGRLRCRHDLVRAALADTVTPVRARQVHGFLVEQLAADATTAADHAQIAAHAVAAGDGPNAAFFSLRAGEQARADGAHREALRHLVNALAHRAHLTDNEIDRALDGAAQEAYFTHDPSYALACATELYDRTDPAATATAGERAWWCSRLAHYSGDAELSIAWAERAVDAYALGDDTVHEAYSRWWLASQRDDEGERDAWSARTVELAIDAGELEIAAHLMVTVAGSRPLRAEVYVPRLVEGLDLGLRGGSLEQTARAYCNLAWITTVSRRFDDAERWLGEGLEWTFDRDLLFWWDAMIDSRALLRLYQGRWDDALTDAAATLDVDGRLDSMQVCAAIASATIALRRGETDAASAMDHADRAADESGMERPLALAVRAEAAWLRGGAADGLGEELATIAALPSAAPWLIGPAMFWLCKLDRADVSGIDRALLPDPVLLELDGDAADAAAAWRAMGCEFEASVIDGLSDDTGTLRDAFEALARLGADATIGRLRRLAEQRGVVGIPRGPRAATAGDPDGLTPRQAEVLALLADHLTDAEIAEALTISTKTAGHHVSAILARLGVGSRREAGAHARARARDIPSADANGDAARPVS
ncbi:AAA family ATPase [Microbacterium awajiense]